MSARIYIALHANFVLFPTFGGRRAVLGKNACVNFQEEINIRIGQTTFSKGEHDDMEYSQQEKQLLFEMKKSIINEFRYHYQRCDKFSIPFVEPDLSIDIEDLQEAFQIGMSNHEKQMLRRYDFEELFSEALGKLFIEELIEFQDRQSVIVSQKGVEMFIDQDKTYQQSERKKEK